MPLLLFISGLFSSFMFLYIKSGHILDLYCIRLLNGAPFCENYAKLYFEAKHLEKGLNFFFGGGAWNFGGPFFKKSFLFHKKVSFLVNIECCLKFLEYALQVDSSTVFSLYITGLYMFVVCCFFKWFEHEKTHLKLKNKMFL